MKTWNWTGKRREPLLPGAGREHQRDPDEAVAGDRGLPVRTGTLSTGAEARQVTSHTAPMNPHGIPTVGDSALSCCNAILRSLLSPCHQGEVPITSLLLSAGGRMEKGGVPESTSSMGLLDT